MDPTNEFRQLVLTTIGPARFMSAREIVLASQYAIPRGELTSVRLHRMHYTGQLVRHDVPGRGYLFALRASPRRRMTA